MTDNTKLFEFIHESVLSSGVAADVAVVFTISVVFPKV